MALICITGSTDGIGLATARVLLSEGHRVLVHARTEERGRAVLAGLDGDAGLVVGDLTRLDDVRRLADQVGSAGRLDVLVHNAGVWVRGDTPRTTPDGFETTFAVNVLAPHLLTHLVADQLAGRLLWLGSGLAGAGRPDPATLGRPQDPRSAYADSKACDVALAMVWGRRLTGVASAAVDPGWVRTKLATPRSAGGRPLLGGHSRLLLHRGRPGVGVLLEGPGADPGASAPPQPRAAGCDRVRLRPPGRHPLSLAPA